MIRVGIIAGETSGDIIASGFIRTFKKHYPDTEFVGIAGPLMEKEGCRALFPMEKLAVMGFSEVFGKLREILGIRKKLRDYFKANPPDVFIGVDAPDFNLKLETWLHDSGIPTVHYVSPSVWAWRQYRIKRIARSVDLMLTLFPFEKQFYHQHKVPVEFVGHTLANDIPLTIDIAEKRKALGLPEDGRYVAMLPGSRMSEVTKLADVFIDAAAQCQIKSPGIEFIIPFVNDKTRQAFEAVRLSKGSEVRFHYFDGQSRDVMAASNVVVLASGTATLEAMLLKKPMVVAYKVSNLSYQIYKRLIKVKYAALPNLLANAPLVPEFLQHDATAENISGAVNRWLDDEKSYNAIAAQFEHFHVELRQDANEKSAQAVLRLIGKSNAE